MRTAGSWSAPVGADVSGGGITAVSCVTGSSCTAVDAAGRAVSWNGASWSAAQPVDRDGGGLTAVSCPAHGRCVATDFDGQIVTIDGHRHH
jgi:hypothetical protein